MDEIIQIVLSRDTDFIFATRDVKWAKEEQQKQIEKEEAMGGRPSVYIKQVFLQDPKQHGK